MLCLMQEEVQIPRSQQRLQEFQDQIFQILEKEIEGKTADKTFPCVFFLPGKLALQSYFL